jgi:hypothetical protein
MYGRNLNWLDMILNKCVACLALEVKGNNWGLSNIYEILEEFGVEWLYTPNKGVDTGIIYLD